jgi:hypothetical protein
MTSRDILVAVHWTVCHKNSKHDRFVSGIKLQTRRLKLNGGKNEAVGIEHDSWGSQSSNGTSTSSWRKFQVEVKHSEASRSVVHLEEILWLTTRAKNHVFRARCHTFSGICATISKSWCRGTAAGGSTPSLGTAVAQKPQSYLKWFWLWRRGVENFFWNLIIVYVYWAWKMTELMYKNMSTQAVVPIVINDILQYI